MSAVLVPNDLEEQRQKIISFLSLKMPDYR